MSAEKNSRTVEQDEILRAVKCDIQKQSREAIRSGRLKQKDLFLVRPELARKAKFEFKK